MRLWLGRRLPEAPPRWDDLLPMEALLRGEIEDVLAVEQRQLWGRTLAFGGQLRVPAGRALDVLRARLEPQGYTPFLRQDGATTWMCALPRAELTDRSNPLVNLALFLATVLTTLLAGAWPMAGVTPSELWAHPGRLVAGLPFAASLLSILAVHEFGHYTVGRRHGMPISLPYFIPAPPPLFPVGTLGAVIRLRGPVRDRRSLFDMAVAGPLAGLVLAVPIVVLGLRFSRVIPSAGVGEGGLELGDSLLLLLLERLVVGPLGADQTLLLHPVGVAGWFGLFVTALNLIPAGQLDGGHLVYAMFGRWHAWISKAAVAVLMAVGLVFGSPTWLVWSALIVALMGFRHAPPMDDVTPLDGKRLALGIFALVLLLLLVPPVPLSIH